jgi:hypothetical protein
MFRQGGLQGGQDLIISFKSVLLVPVELIGHTGDVL